MKDSGLETPLAFALHWCFSHPWFLLKYKYFHFFRHGLAYLCPQILWFLKKRDTELLVIPHVLCIMFSPVLKVLLFVFISGSVHVRSVISKRSISGADALTPCVFQTLLLFVCHNTFHQNQPVFPSATSRIFPLSLELQPFPRLLTSEELILNLYPTYWFAFLCHIYELTLAGI